MELLIMHDTYSVNITVIYFKKIKVKLLPKIHIFADVGKYCTVNVQIMIRYLGSVVETYPG